MASNIIEVVARGKDLTSGVFSKMGKNVVGSLKNITGSIFNVKNALVGLAGAAGVGGLVKGFVNAASKTEDFRTRLISLTKSTDIAEKKLKALSDFAGRSPFELEGIIEAGITLEAFGAKAEDTIEPLGDLAAFMGIDIVEASRAFGRAFAAGAGAADILRERGVLTLVKMQTGIEDLTKLTLPEFRKALVDTMTDPDGKIFGATQRLATTFTGQVSMMSDALFRMRDTIGQALLPAMKDLVTNHIVPTINRIKDWAEANKELIATKFNDFISILVSVFSRLVDVGVRVYTFISNLINKLDQIGIIEKFNKGIAKSTEGLGFLYNASLDVLSGLAGINTEMSKSSSTAVLLSRLFSGLTAALKQMAFIISDVISGYYDLRAVLASSTEDIKDFELKSKAAREVALELAEEAKVAFQEFLSGIKDIESTDPAKPIEIVIEVVKDLPIEAEKAFSQMEMSGKKSAKGLQSSFSDIFFDFFDNKIQKLSDMWNNFGDKLRDKFFKILSDISSEIASSGIGQFAKNLLNGETNPEIGEGNATTKAVTGVTAQLGPQIASSVNSFLAANPAVMMALIAAAVIAAVNSGVVRKVFDGITSLVKKIPQIITDFAKEIPDMIESLFDNVLSILEVIPDIIESIINLLPDLMSRILEKLPVIMSNIISRLPTIMVEILSKLPLIVIEYQSQLPKIMRSILEQLPKIATEILSELPKTMYDAVIEGLKNLPKKIAESLKDIFGFKVGGFSRGGGGGGGLIDNVLDSAGDVLDDIGDFFGFHKGGIVRAHKGLNLASDEVPIVAQTGEGILSRRGMAALGSNNLDRLNNGNGLGGINIERLEVLPNVTDMEFLFSMPDSTLERWTRLKLIPALDNLSRRGIEPVFAG